MPAGKSISNVNITVTWTFSDWLSSEFLGCYPFRIDLFWSSDPQAIEMLQNQRLEVYLYEISHQPHEWSDTTALASTSWI